MAKGYKLNKERLDKVSALGKTLVRRCGSKCELCEVSGEKMSVVEIQPAPEIPDPDHALMLCDTCRKGVEGGKLSEERWRFLDQMVWSELPQVQVTAIRLCRRLGDQGAEWTVDLLSDVYVSPEVEEWLEMAL